jgi:hypothetical protein
MRKRSSSNSVAVIADVRGIVRVGKALASSQLPIETLRGPAERSTREPAGASAHRDRQHGGQRRLTFGVVGRAGVARHQAQGLAVFALGLGLTSGSLAALHVVSSTPTRWVELSILVLANLAATLLRFLLFRSWVFRGHVAGKPLPRQAEREQAAGH